MSRNWIVPLAGVAALGVASLGLVGWAVAQSGGLLADAGVEDKRARFESVPLDVTFPDVEALIEAAKARDAAEASNSRVVWSRFITPESIKREVEFQITDSEDTVKNPGYFKSTGIRRAPRQYGIAGTMLNLATRYDQDLAPIGWTKEEAAAMRDVAAEAFSMITIFGADDDSFAASQTATEQIKKFLASGETEAEPVNEEMGWSDEVIGIGSIMQRMEQAQRGPIQSYTANEGEFKAQKDRLIHEASVLAVVAQLLLDPSFNRNEADFREWVTELRDNNLKFVEAAKAGDFIEATKLYGASNLTCTECHGAYRN